MDTRHSPASVASEHNHLLYTELRMDGFAKKKMHWTDPLKEKEKMHWTLVSYENVVLSQL